MYSSDVITYHYLFILQLSVCTPSFCSINFSAKNEHQDFEPYFQSSSTIKNFTSSENISCPSLLYCPRFLQKWVDLECNHIKRECLVFLLVIEFG